MNAKEITSAVLSYYHAKYVLHAHFPLGENIIATCENSLKLYKALSLEKIKKRPKFFKY